METPILEVSVGRDSDTGRVFCMDSRPTTMLNLEVEMPFSEMKKGWLVDCHATHITCRNLLQTRTNPSKLIRIMTNGDLKLVSLSAQEPVEYAALSYDWFGRETLDPMDKDKVTKNKTTQRNIALREKGFSTQELSATIQDALWLIRKLGLSFLWVDSVCIPKGADWNDEGSKMHLVYGNAYVTLCTCSSEYANNGLRHRRKAWEYRNEACRLDEQWLITEDMSLNEVRSRAPLFTRGWVLQEERLSPRIIYLCGQRAYWSCFQAQCVEVGFRPGNSHKPLESSQASYEWLRPPKLFLETRRKCELEKLHQQWLEMVRDYVQRGLSYDTDRFDAISGLAAQYLRVYTNSEDNEVLVEEYLAGLWRTRFPHNLSWTVSTPKPRSNPLIDVAPTWSWASLPLESSCVTREDFPKTDDDLSLLTEPQLGNVGKPSTPLDVVRRGALVKSVVVEGRFWPFTSKQSISVDWSNIQADDRGDDYDTSKYLRISIHSRNPKNGKVLFSEGGTQPIVGQLDYLYPEDTLDLKELHCLKLGKDAMLLLVKATSKNGDQQDDTYRRVGICNNYRENFFMRARRKDVTLI